MTPQEILPELNVAADKIAVVTDDLENGSQGGDWQSEVLAGLVPIETSLQSVLEKLESLVDEGGVANASEELDA